MPPAKSYSALRAASLAVILLLGSCNAEEAAADITLDRGWMRETRAGQSAGAGYLLIVNRGEGADRILGASSPSAANVSLHSTTHEDGIVRMRPLERAVVQPRGVLSFTPGGNHVMLAGLKRPLAPGESIMLTLRFERSGEREIALRVTDASADPSTAGLR